MPRSRATLLLVVVVMACGGSDRGSLPSRGASSVPFDTARVGMTGDWPTDLGGVLLVPADTENLAVVLYPAPPAVADTKTEVALLAANGSSVQSKAAIRTDSAHCGDAPMLRLVSSQPWSLGLNAGKVRALPSDSLEGMSHDDSISYSTEGARLASIVTAGIQSRVAGLSFSLVALRRLRVGDTIIIAAQLVRRVNQEANPAEERTFVVAERAGSGPFTMVHSDRSEGTEDTAAHFDLIGAFRAGPSLYLLVSTDSPAGSTLEILERANGAWRVRWTRTISC